MSICIAVSGGTDSLYAMAALKEAGEQCMALHAVFLPEHLRPADHAAMIERLKACCASLGIPLHIADLVEPFRQAVIEPFVRSYAEGATPNPCAQCNAAIKFGLLMDIAREKGADRLVTGHYARLEAGGDTLGDGFSGDSTGLHTPGSCFAPALYAGADKGKDQSYFLSLVPAERLVHALFPLGGLRKEDIRAWLAERGITPPAPRESQEICFVPDDAYREFIPDIARSLRISLPGPGPVRLRDGREIGRHSGLWRYTEGQRKGLGIAWQYPLYVLEKDMASNTLIVGGKEEGLAGEFRCASLNFLVPLEAWPQEVLVRTRYRQSAAPVTILPQTHTTLENGSFRFSQEPSRGPYTVGQLATFYAQDEGGSSLRVLAGGVIS